MKYFKRFIATFLFTLLIVSLSACAPNLALPAATPTSVTTAEAAATPTATVVPTATPVPTLSPEEEKEILNQKFQDFLNYQGEFTKDKMLSMMMKINHPYDKEAVGLGISTYQPEIQGYLFDCIEKENRIILLMGFDGKDGKRFITPVEIYLFENPDYPDASGFTFTKYYANDMEVPYVVDEVASNEDTIYYVADDYCEDIGCKGRDETTSFLDNLKNNIIVLSLNQYTQTEAEILAPIEGELLEFYQQEYGAQFDPSLVEAFNRDVLLDYYMNESNPKVELSVGLIELVETNDFDYGILDLQIVGNSSAIIKIDNAFNLDDIDISKVPIVESVIFYEGILDE